MEIIFATHNPNKLKEVQQLLPAHLHLKGLKEIGFTKDIPETGNTLNENAWIKADTIFNTSGIACFADDTGLEVSVLNGAPGVYSARYAGPEANALKNMEKLLQALESHTDRSAQFRTVIALHFNQQKFTFEGVVKGKIIRTPRGSGGFGYDPIFQPDGFETTFAEMDLDTKNKISHRGLAFQQLLHFLASPTNP